MAMGTAAPQNYFLPTTISSADAKIGHVSHGGPGQVKVEARASPSLSPVVGDQLAGHGGNRDAPSPFHFHVDGDVQAYQQQLILEHQQQQEVLRQHLLQSGYPSSALSSPFAFKLHAPSSGHGHGVAQGLSHDVSSHHASRSSCSPFLFDVSSSHPPNANSTPQPPPSASSSITSSSSNSLFSVNGRGAASPARSDPSSTGGESVVVGTAGSNHPPIATPAPLYRFGASSGSQNIGPNTLTNPSAHNYNYTSAYTPSTSQSQTQAAQQRHSSNSNRSRGFSTSSRGGGSGGNSPQSWTPQQQQQLLAQQHLAQQQQQQHRYQREQQIRLQQQLANSQIPSSKLHTSDENLGQNLGRQHLSNNTHHHSHSIAQPQPHHQLSASNTAHLNHHLNQHTTPHNSHHALSIPNNYSAAPQHQLPSQARTHFHQSNHNHGALAHRFSSGNLSGIPMSYSDDYDTYNEFDEVNEIPASELGATFASLTSGGTAVNSSGPGGISLDGSMGDDREALRQRDRARDREEREREMDRGMTDRERERTVRRRSSKACDQCRKSKCKCERASPNDPCKNCVMLGTPCTFLGPSRKRGPPKGYIDAIEARLHQTEALLGIMLSTRDERARSLLKDIGKDPLAREIITRVDNSPYGVKGRKDNGSLAAKAPGRTLASTAGTTGALLGSGPEEGSGFVADDEDEDGDAKMDDMLVVSDPEGNMESSKFDLTSTHPSNEWQDRVSSMLDARAAKIVASRTNPSSRSIPHSDTNAVASSSPDLSASHADVSSSGNNPDSPNLHQDDHAATGRRTRRRVGEAEYDLEDLAGPLMFSAGQERERSDSAFRADRDRDSSNANAHMLQNKRFSDIRTGAGPSRHQHSAAAQESGNNTSIDSEHHPRGSNVPSFTTRLLNHSRSRVNMHRGYANPGYRTSSPSDSDDSDNLEGAIGKLSINEDDQVRYHGKASGLYLLAATSSNSNPRAGSEPETGARPGISGVGNDPRSSPEDASMTESIRPQRGRREDGIWRFPKARVWPPLPSGANASEEMSPMYMASGVGGLQYAPSLRQSAGPPGAKNMNMAILPPREVQAHLLALFFAHVQPIFPIVHKKAFWEGYNALMEQIDPGKTYQASPQASNYSSTSVPPSLDQSAGLKPKKLKPVSALLLFAMFAVASRYDERFSPPKPADPFRTIWTSGDEYLDRAHKELGSTHGVSHGQASGHCPETVQALLLLGYREIGIGAMAQAWGYVGWGVRMAQDLGMHRSAEGWERGDREPKSEKAIESQGNTKDVAGSRKRQLIFTAQELDERKRIWYGCLIMDTYASTTIGRPLMIFEWDYDTPLPDPEDASSEEGAHMQTINEGEKEFHGQCVNEEWERWTPEERPVGRAARQALSDHVVSSEGMRSRSISCFNASAILSGILGTILQTVYAIRPVSSRHAESVVLEGVLDKWYLNLPEHLRFEPATCAKALSAILNAKGSEQGGVTSSAGTATIKVPPSHVLTLHMHYWCAVLLLHRPFIRQVVASARVHAPTSASPANDSHGGKISGQSGVEAERADLETRAVAEKSFELCNAAANHITSLVALYQEQYVITHCPAYFVYYVFTATIAHDITLTVRPGDPQAKTGLQRCIRALRSMSTVWPGAARAIELFGRSRIASAQDADVHVARRANNHEAISPYNKRVATHDVEAMVATPSIPSTQNSGHGWSSTNDTTSIVVGLQQEQNAATHPRPPIAPASVNVPYDPTNTRQQPQNTMQPPYNYQSVQNSHNIPQSTIYPPPGLYRAEKAMSILAASAGANDSFYRLHPQSSSRTNLDPDVRPANPQYQQQQQQSGSAFNHNPYGGSGDNDSNAMPSWPPTGRVQHQDLAAIDPAVHGGFTAEPPLSMTALPHLYHNTGIVDQPGLGFHPHAHTHGQQQQGQGQYSHLPQQHYLQHPSSLAIGGASARRTPYTHGAVTQPLSAFENYDSSYAPQTNIVVHQPPPQPPQSQDGVYTSEQGYEMFDNAQYFNNQ